MGNKKGKTIFLFIIIFILFCVFANSVFAIDPNNYSPELTLDDTFIGKAGNILSWIQYIGILVSLVALVIIGLKYLLSSVEGKAEYKKTMWGYVIGCFLLMAISLVIGLIGNVMYNGESIKTGKSSKGETKETSEVGTGDIKEKIKSNITNATMAMTSYGNNEFWLYTPEYITEDTPVIFFWGGSGEDGLSLEAIEAKNALCSNLKNKKIGTDAIIIIPRTTGFNYSDTTKSIIKGLQNGKISDSKGRKLSIDINNKKVGVIAYSAGVNSFLRNSDKENLYKLFDCAVLISGQSTENTGPLRHIKSVITYGGTASAEEQSYSKAMKNVAKQVNNSGGNATFIECTGADHGTIIEKLFNNSNILDTMVKKLADDKNDKETQQVKEENKKVSIKGNVVVGNYSFPQYLQSKYKYTDGDFNLSKARVRTNNNGNDCFRVN